MEPETMTLNRSIFTDRSTIGEIYLDGKFECYSLELTTRYIPNQKNCIPAGKYEMLMQYSTRFKMDTPHLQNVPGRTFIEIHPGNKPEDTEGCILVGQTISTDWVGSSRAAYKELIPKLEARLKLGKVYIEITGDA